RQNPEVFGAVYDPASDPFFRRNGLLYLSKKELADLADRLAEAQPFLGTLWKDPSLRGLFDLIGLAVTETLKAERKDGKAGKAPIEIATVLDTMAATIEDQAAGKFARLSWQNVMQGKTASLSDTRRFLLLKPALNFSSLQPATEAMKKLRSLFKELNLDAEHGVRVRITGSAALAQEELKSVETGMGYAAVLSLVLVASLLIVGLRSVHLFFATIVTLIVGLIWTAGFAIAAFGQLNLMSVAFAVLFIGLSVDFGIHFALRYREEDSRTGDHAGSLERAARSVGGSLALCAVAAGIAFFAFLPTDYIGLAELGVIAGTGMFVAFFANLTVLPALLTVLPAGNGRRDAKSTGRTPTVLPFIRRHARPVIWGALGLGIAAAFLLPQVRFDFDPLNLRDPKTESLATLLELVNDTQTSPYGISILAADLPEARKLAAKLEPLPEVKDVRTIADYVPKEQDEKLGIIGDMGLLLIPSFSVTERAPRPSVEEQKAALKALRDHLAALATESLNKTARASAKRLNEALGKVAPNGKIDAATLDKLRASLLSGLPRRLEMLRESLEAQRVTLKDLPTDIKQREIAPDGRVRMKVYPKQNVRDQDALLRFVNAVRAVAPDAVGAPVVIFESSRTVIRAFIEAAAIAVGCISVLLLIVLRNVREALFVFAPITLAALLTVSASVLLGLHFNFANVIVLPLLFGLGVASGIHFVLREREALIDGGVIETSTPRAVVFSALTTIGSFGSIALSSHPGTASMGVLLTIAISLTLVCTLVVLPALMAVAARPK
ncbi:MAG: MMPL family transporter, partial [Rhodospirillales bacterium]